MTPLQALAQVVEAGRAGQPPTPDALDALAAVLQALQDGTDPGKAFAPPRTRGRKHDYKKLERHFWRVVTVLELMQDGLTEPEARERVRIHDPRTGAAPLDPGISDTHLRKLMRGLEQLAGDLLVPDPPPMPDRPDASKDFKD